MDTGERLKTLVDEAIDYGKTKTDVIIARVNAAQDSQIRFSQSSIDISKRWNSLQLELFVLVKGKKTGSTVRPVSSVSDVKKAVDDVVTFSEILPDSMFFAGVEDKVQSYPELNGQYDSKIDDFTESSPEVINSVVDQALQEGAKRVAGALMIREEHFFFRSSLGPEGEGKSTAYDLNVRALQNELDYSGQGLDCGTQPSKSEKDMLDAGAKAGRLSKQAIGAVQGKPGIYDLILSPTVAANVLGRIPGQANPFLIMMAASPLQDRMGEQIAPEFVTAYEDPLFKGGLNSTNFDWEGTPSRTITIVDKGVLKQLIHNTTTARMFEAESTGSSRLAQMGMGMRMLLPGPSNIVFKNGDHNMDELLDVSRPTIYVTCNWYSRFQNQQTGDFSTIPRDAMFLIEKGEMKPIKNMRISDNTMRMFANIDALGNDRTQIFWWEVRTPTVLPTMRIRDCRMTAATQ
ncbi:MAG: TldD/PmbA family protein [Candidatus Thorarchaeota archaeon]|nr:TldD/PmbA family protein [Candidatus Thorarchaeota archaeon]